MWWVEGNLDDIEELIESNRPWNIPRTSDTCLITFKDQMSKNDVGWERRTDTFIWLSG